MFAELPATGIGIEWAKNENGNIVKVVKGVRDTDKELTAWHVQVHSAVEYREKRISSQKRKIAFKILLFQYFMFFRDVICLLNRNNSKLWFAFGNPVYVYDNAFFMTASISLYCGATALLRSKLIRIRFYKLHCTCTSTTLNVHLITIAF